MISVEDLRSAYGSVWAIATDLTYGVAAWRRAGVTQADFEAGRLHSLLAWDLDELAEKLARQEAAR